MSVQAHNCNPDQIAGFLERSLSNSEVAALEDHLSECSACRELLGDQTAAAELWDKASRYLRDDQDEPAHLSGPSDLTPAQDRSHAIQAVLDSLRPTDDPEMLGRLGGLEVAGVVGAGAMGVVLKAFDNSLDRTVAVKVLAPHLASSGAARKRFAREAKAAAAVLHPNVMAIHSVSNDDLLPHLVMPYFRGASLQKRLDQEGPPPLPEILRIGTQIAAGLAAAHAQGLVHRDVKPANILLEEGVERVAITDFGLARAVDDATMTRTGVIAGTPQYMSPEQARGESVDQRSDLFSLGSVLYAMCTGRSPFRADTSYGVLRRLTDKEPRPIREINPDIPEWFCAIVEKLMSKRLEDRFQSAEQLAELLEDCLAHVQQPHLVPLPQNACPPVSPARKPQSRRPVFRLLLAAAIAIPLLFAGAQIVLQWNKGKLIIESDADNVPVRITQGDRTVEKLTVMKAGTSVRIAAGRYQVELPGEYDGLVIENNTFTSRRGAEEVVRIKHVERADRIPPSRRRPANDLPPPTPATGVEPKRRSAEATKKATEYIETLDQRVKALEEAYRAGEVSWKRVMGARLDLLKAQLELANSAEERIGTLAKQVAILSELEKAISALHKDGVCSLDEVLAARADRIDAEKRLQLERDVQFSETSSREPQRSDVLQFSGTLDYDERRTFNVYTRMPARIEELHLDYKDVEVKKGDPLVTLYSSELHVAEVEFLRIHSQKGVVAGQLIRVARQKLRLLGLSGGQIDHLAEQNKASGRRTLVAPSNGIVTAMEAQEGGHVKSGERLFTIADPTRLWARLDVGEAHLGAIRLDQPVVLTAVAYPDQRFSGRIEFIEPRIDPKTRTFAIRVDVSNPESKLKPGMSVTAVTASVQRPKTDTDRDADLDGGLNQANPGAPARPSSPLPGDIAPLQGDYSQPSRLPKGLRDRLGPLQERLIIPSNASFKELPDRYEFTASPWNTTMTLVDGDLPSRAHDSEDAGHSHRADGKDKDGHNAEHKHDTAHEHDADHHHELTSTEYFADAGKLAVPKAEQEEIILELVGNAGFAGGYIHYSAERIVFHLGGSNDRMILSGNARFANDADDVQLSADEITNKAEWTLLEGNARLRRKAPTGKTETISAERLEMDHVAGTIKVE